MSFRKSEQEKMGSMPVGWRGTFDTETQSWDPKHLDYTRVKGWCVFCGDGPWPIGPTFKAKNKLQWIKDRGYVKERKEQQDAIKAGLEHLHEEICWCRRCYKEELTKRNENSGKNSGKKSLRGFHAICGPSSERSSGPSRGVSGLVRHKSLKRKLGLTESPAATTDEQINRWEQLSRKVLNKAPARLGCVRKQLRVAHETLRQEEEAHSATLAELKKEKEDHDETLLRLERLLKIQSMQVEDLKIALYERGLSTEGCCEEVLRGRFIAFVLRQVAEKDALARELAE